ncbi:hypothetical protein HGRIS_004504 [Hohenbuehelia grisea]|uniref:Zn(2)-C6 fungal-type domain-containing protein n=1 Tax=Hohenbuehelia grisea TaxID=104357 RepID=A0ABR3JCR1_9AGAR
MPAAPKPTPQKKQQGGAPKAKGAVRAKSGCYTCRIRRKKCDERPNPQGHCETCVRLRLECLGFGAKRPEWLRENRNVVELRDRIKHFLASQGMIKGHSGSGPRNAEQEPPVLKLNGDGEVVPQQTRGGSHSPTPTLSASSPESRNLPPLPSFNLSALRDQHDGAQWVLPPLHQASGPHQIHNYTTTTPAGNVRPDANPHYHPSSGPYHEIIPPTYHQNAHNPPSPPAAAPVHSISSLVPQPWNGAYVHRQPVRTQKPWQQSTFGDSYYFDSYENDSPDNKLTALPGGYSNGQLVVTNQGYDYAIDPSLQQLDGYDGLEQPQYRLMEPMMDFVYRNPSPFVDGLVDHYMNQVINIQYLLANKSRTAQMINETLETHPCARDAVRLLASVHQNKVRNKGARNKASMRALETDNSAVELYNGLNDMLRVNGPQSGEEAMAVVLAISSVLFDGGTGDWRVWLGLACSYIDRNIFTPDVHPQLAWLRLSTQDVYERDAFVVKTTLWFDVLASATLRSPPHFLNVINNLFDPRQSAHIDGGGEAVPSLLDVMGCENTVFWAMAQTSYLSCWKEQQQRRGTLSIPQLVMQGQTILSALGDEPPPVPPAGLDKEALCRFHTSAIFRASMLVWLHAIMSNDCAAVPELSAAVQHTLNRFRAIPQDDPQVVRQIVRSSVFSVFMCGVFTLARDDRDYLVNHLHEQSRDNVGNCTAIEHLMKKIWAEADAARQSRRRQSVNSVSVNWREPLRKSRILLV